MITFGGSPTGVIAPPIFEKIIMHIKIGTGLRVITSHSLQHHLSIEYKIKNISTLAKLITLATLAKLK